MVMLLWRWCCWLLLKLWLLWNMCGSSWQLRSCRLNLTWGWHVVDDGELRSLWWYLSSLWEFMMAGWDYWRAGVDGMMTTNRNLLPSSVPRRFPRQPENVSIFSPRSSEEREQKLLKLQEQECNRLALFGSLLHRRLRLSNQWRNLSLVVIEGWLLNVFGWSSLEDLSLCEKLYCL